MSSLSLFASEEGDRTEVEIVTIGETTYTTDPDTKEWQARPSTEEDFEFTLASAIVKSMTDAIKLDDDEVDGVVFTGSRETLGQMLWGRRKTCPVQTRALPLSPSMQRFGSAKTTSLYASTGLRMSSQERR